MTITELTRRCSACNDLLNDGESKCGRCGRVQALPISEWPDGAKRFLFLLIVADALGTKLDSTPQQQFERLLENTIRGRWYDGHLVPYAASASECYPQFITLLARWKAQDSPTDFAAIAQLRGAR